MNNISKFVFLFGIIVSISFSCDKGEGENEKPEEITFKLVKGLSVCDDSCNLKINKYNDTSFIINSQLEYESLFECYSYYELPFIDFSKYTLLTGSKTVGGICPTIVSQQVLKYTINKKIIYKVLVKAGGYSARGSAYYHALISKVEDKFDIEFDVTIEPIIY